MKKIISWLSALAIAFGSLAYALPAQAVVPAWDVTDTYVVAFQLTGDPTVYAHDAFLTQDSLGNITGNGGYLAGSPPYSYDWNITSGSISGSTINLTILYDVGAPDTVMHMTGTVAPDGTMSGDWDDDFGGPRTGTWATTSGNAASLVVYVDNLQPDYDAIGAGGVYSAYYGPPAHNPVSPGATALYDGRQAGIIKAGQGLEPAPSDWDEGLFAFRPTATINAFEAVALTYDVQNEFGVNPVWMTIEIDIGVPGDRSDNVVFQHVPTANPAGWHTVDAGDGLWQKWNNNEGDTTGNPLISLSDIASDPLYTGLNVVRTYLRLGMGTSYYLPTTDENGTVGWVDKITLGGVTYDFVLPDADNDSVPNENDKCPGTVEDTPDVSLGKNRWMWNGSAWVTNGNNPGGFSPNMTYTHGCSGEQILDALVDATGLPFDGHYKYGVSKSILDDWHNGIYYLETVSVPASDTDGASSLSSLIAGKNYKLKASGTAFACSEPTCTIEFDAEYSTSDAATWVDGVAPPYESYGPNLLDLTVNGGFVDWDNDAVYNADHTYWYELAGTGAPVSLQISDLYYPNNTASLTVDIYVKLY